MSEDYHIALHPFHATSPVSLIFGRTRAQAAAAARSTTAASHIMTAQPPVSLTTTSDPKLPFLNPPRRDGHPQIRTFGLIHWSREHWAGRFCRVIIHFCADVASTPSHHQDANKRVLSRAFQKRCYRPSTGRRPQGSFTYRRVPTYRIYLCMDPLNSTHFTVGLNALLYNIEGFMDHYCDPGYRVMD